MFSSSFTMSEHEHRQWTLYKPAAPGSLREHDTDPLAQQDGISGDRRRRPGTRLSGNSRA
jgi:hypothetical protein